MIVIISLRSSINRCCHQIEQYLPCRFASSYHQMTEPEKFILGARAGEGWKFVKWTKDGEDFSTEEIITVKVTEDAEYVACFDLADEEASSEES